MELALLFQPMNKRILFLDLRRLNQMYHADFQQIFAEFLQSGWYIMGQQLAAFEAAYAHYSQVSHCIGVANGLDALTLSLRALGIGPGHEVIVPANTYVASWLAVSAVGATPVPVDADIDFYNIDIQRIENAITPRTRAIMPVHLYGNPCDMPAVMAIAARHHVWVTEDNAQAQGARWQGQPTGSFGHCNATSFYPTKNLGALGDGGAITTSDPALASQLAKLRNYGSAQKYHHELKGTNSRLDEIQAAWLALKLQTLDATNKQRRALAALYQQGLAGVGDLVLPRHAAAAEPVYHIFCIRTQYRDSLQQFLANQGIETMIHYPVPPYLQPAYQELGYGPADFPVATELAATALSLPIGPYLAVEEVDDIVSSIKKFFHG